MSFLELLNIPILGIVEGLSTIGTIALYASLAASAAGSYISYASAQTAAKQAEYNAQAQQDEIAQEKRRQAAEEAENQRRAVQEQRRQRAAQLAAMGSTGAMLGTGTPLAIEADTWAKQQTELADAQRMAELSQRQLAYQGYSIGFEGKTQAAAIRRQATGQAISDLGSLAGQAYGSFSTRPTSTQPTAYNYKTRQPMAGSTNIG
jgi:hypothetical protein